MADRLLRADEHGLYVQTGGYTFRPLDALRSADRGGAPGDGVAHHRDQ